MQKKNLVKQEVNGTLYKNPNHQQEYPEHQTKYNKTRTTNTSSQVDAIPKIHYLLPYYVSKRNKGTKKNKSNAIK